MQPSVLYHGSLYKQNELMPGFKRSGKLVQWDGIENNTYLYATTDQQEAISLGLGSALEKELDSRRFATFDNNIVVYFNGELPTKEDIVKLVIYVYTIRFKESDKWVKNNNPLNNIDTEWLTQSTIRNLVKCDQINLEEWLSDKQLILTTRALDTCPMSVVKDTANWNGKTVQITI